MRPTCTVGFFVAFNSFGLRVAIPAHAQNVTGSFVEAKNSKYKFKMNAKFGVAGFFALCAFQKMEVFQMMEVIAF